MPLETEQRTYDRKLPDLLVHEGRFTLIKGEEVVGIYPSWEAGVRAGYERFGRVPFMVREIRREPEVAHVLSPLG